LDPDRFNVKALVALHGFSGVEGMTLPTMFVSGGSDGRAQRDAGIFKDIPAAYKVYAAVQGSRHMEPYQPGRLNPFVAHFMGCHVADLQESCDMVYGNGSDALCQANLMSNCEGMTPSGPITTTTTTACHDWLTLRDAGGEGCLKSSGGGKLLEKGGTSNCARFCVEGTTFWSVDVPGQCLDLFAEEGFGLWDCHGEANQQLHLQGSTWCVDSSCVEVSGPLNRTTTTNTAKMTTTKSSTTTSMTAGSTTAATTLIASSSSVPISTTRGTETTTEYLVAEDRATCSKQGFLDVPESKCQVACESLGFTSYQSGRWSHSPRCFASVSGPYKGNCHWNSDVSAKSYSGNARPLCVDPMTASTTATTMSTSIATTWTSTSNITAWTTTTTTQETATLDFSEVDGGENRACRGASSMDNSAKYYQVSAGIPDLESCKALCVSRPGCVGIEFHKRGRCEIWTRPEGIGATAGVPGYHCLRYLPTTLSTSKVTTWTTTTTTQATATLDFSEVDGGENRACRGASSMDNSAKYYQVSAGIPDLESCKALCVSRPGCVGIEFHKRGRCEIWTRPEGIGATAGVPGYHCLRYVPLPALMQGTKLRGGKAARARAHQHTLYVAGNAFVQGNTSLSKRQWQEAGVMCEEDVL